VADVVVRYWAGAREAAGRDEEPLAVASVRAAVELLTARDAGLGEVLARSSLLVDGVVVRTDLELLDGQVVEVLPPFAGG
jgi:molybdopterin synthase sulfur carrier subunit